MSKMCCLCGYEYDGHGHNAQPVKDGECCDGCNSKLVLVAWSLNHKLFVDEIVKLREMLKKNNIPYAFRVCSGGYQLVYPGFPHEAISVIERLGSYGMELDLLETMTWRGKSALNGSVEGFLSADEVYKRIAEHWEKSSLPRKNPPLTE